MYTKTKVAPYIQFFINILNFRNNYIKNQLEYNLNISLKIEMNSSGDAVIIIL